MLVYMYVYQYIDTKVKELLSCFFLRQLLPEKNTACHAIWKMSVHKKNQAEKSDHFVAVQLVAAF